MRNKLYTIAALVMLTMSEHLYCTELREGKLVDVQKINPTIRINLFLATGNNPLDLVLYAPDTPCYVIEEVAHALDALQKELQPLGYGLLIKDGFRPLWAQRKLWEAVQKFNFPNPDDYISDPYVEGGRHTRGTAVDVSLVHLSDGTELAMPPFAFAPVSHQHYEGPELSAEQIKNRDFLKSMMIKHGFTPIRTEWWHYDFKNWRTYKPMNYQFSEIPLLAAH